MQRKYQDRQVETSPFVSKIPIFTEKQDQNRSAKHTNSKSDCYITEDTFTLARLGTVVYTGCYRETVGGVNQSLACCDVTTTYSLQLAWEKEVLK